MTIWKHNESNKKIALKDLCSFGQLFIFCSFKICLNPYFAPKIKFGPQHEKLCGLVHLAPSLVSRGSDNFLSISFSAPFS